MSSKEFERLEVLQCVLEGRLKQVETAAMLKITTHHLRRLVDRFNHRAAST